MQLGPIQTEWIKSLREHPKRQLKNSLGKKEGFSYKACCLGELLCVAKKLAGEPEPFDEDGVLYSRHHNNTRSYSSLFNHEKFGLRSNNGDLYNSYAGYTCLAQMNDKGMTWPEIADYIEANSDNVFTEPK